MEKIALYRKYRPESFKEMIGQEHIVKTLQSSLENKSLAHAYLFTGPRGTGKTSLARILAKELKVGKSDLYEMDGASNRGIEDARDLKKSVESLPFESKYKFYIIDEVHMLTKEAFNALLKTLEEPPSYVIFILATTEIEKIPETIISRCQVFDFKQPNRAVLAEIVAKTAKKEGFSLEASSADLIAFLGDGSFRDTYGILQKVISTSQDKKISREEVESITGAPKNKVVFDFLEGVAKRNTEACFLALQEVEKKNIDVKVFSELILRLMRYLIMFKISPALKKDLENKITSEEKDFLENLKEIKPGIDSKILSAFLKASEAIKNSSLPILRLEIFAGEMV